MKSEFLTSWESIKNGPGLDRKRLSNVLILKDQDSNNQTQDFYYKRIFDK